MQWEIAGIYKSVRCTDAWQSKGRHGPEINTTFGDAWRIGGEEQEDRGVVEENTGNGHRPDANGNANQGRRTK